MFPPSDPHTRSSGWISSSHTCIRENITWATSGSRNVRNRVNWTPEFGQCPEYTGHEMEKQRALMKTQRERREKEMMVQSEDSRNHWQPSTTNYRPERDGDSSRAKSYGELEEWVKRWCYNHSLLRRRRLQGEMWSEIQNTLKTERTSASTSGPFSTEPRQRSGVNIFKNTSSHQLPPPYTSVKHETSGKMLKEQAQRTGLSSVWNQPPNYTPPPPYTSPPDTHKLTGTLEPHRASPGLRTEYSSTFAENQPGDEADSVGTLTRDTTLKEEPREEHHNQTDQNVRLHKLIEELRNEREELRKRSTEKRSAIGLKTNKHEDADSNKEKEHATPAVSSKSTTLVGPHHQTIPLWMEPICSENKTNRSREGRFEQSEPRKNTMTNENTGLVAINATCVVIKVEFLDPPEKEHVQYMSSCPTDPSKQRCDSIQNEETTELATDRRSEVKIINQTNHMSSKVQTKHETLKERAERILGIQDSFNEAHITLTENSRIQQIHDASEETADHESESLLKAECENVEIPKTSTPNEEAALSSMSEAEAMLESSEVTHRDDENVRTGHEVMALSTKQDTELKSGDRKFILDEKIPSVIDIKGKQVKASAEGSPSGENLNQSLLRNSSETFSQKSKRGEDDLVHETDQRRDLNQVLLIGSLKNASETFSQEDEVNSSKFQRGDHDEDISLLAERDESVLLNSYERDTDKVLDHERKPTDENPPITIHNLQRTSEMLDLEGDHHQENLLNLLDLQSTSETLQQESRPEQNLSCSGDPQAGFGHHVEDTTETLAPEVTPGEEHLSDIWPNLLHSSVVNISEKDILREDRPSHTKHDANHIHQTLPGHSMKNTSESCDLEDVLGEGNLSSDEVNLFSSIRDIRKSEQSFLHEDGEEMLSSASSQTDMLLDDLQNLFDVSVTCELMEQEGNETITSPSSPSSDLQALSTEKLTSSLLSPLHAEISPHPPDPVSSTLLSPPPTGSSLSRPYDSLSEISRVHAQAGSSALSMAKNSIRARACPGSLWDAVSRIRRHTAPDSETEEDEGEVWEPVEPGEDHLSKNAGIKDEESDPEETSRCAGVQLQDVRRHAAEMKDEADDSLSSSSVDSLDTVIEGESRRNLLETDEEDEKIQESDLFSENGE
ncbi:hypothetical protein KOW79_017218 [Hemibagrus wyckioides]|uniref:Uncharacterized protein n=1 Tax=Hemibagrus wyckioides TaxID=337641 RepID=A0A9D3NA90_9TELE|nr:hypothetical protein KOW79_017218 [Hemibagrus wyckioides]